MSRCPVFTLTDGYHRCGRMTVTRIADPTHPFDGLAVCEWHEGFDTQSEQGFIVTLTCEAVA